MLYGPFNLRMVITLLTFGIFNFNILTLIIIIFALDFIDGDIYKLISWDFNFTKTHEYQRYDKLADIITYIIAISLYHNLFDSNTLMLLIILIVWRSIGVWKYFYKNDNNILITHFDGINIVMIVYYLSTVNAVVKNNYSLSIVGGLIFKYLFEIFHHRRIYS